VWNLYQKYQLKGFIMSEERTCLRCGSTNLEAGEFQSTGKIYSRPKHAKLVTLLTTGVPVNTIMCYDCGHVELVVDTKKAKSIAKVS
jgi:predicted nucleic-acid-binding Zn-ribbon protein